MARKGRRLTKKITKIMYKRAFLFVLIVIAQLALLFGISVFLYQYKLMIYLFSTVIAFILMIHIMNNNENPMYKLGWMIPIFFLPIIGIIIYLLSRLKIFKSKLNRKYTHIVDNTSKFITQDDKVIQELKEDNDFIASMAEYTKKYGGYPIYNDSDVTYFKSGRDFFEDMKKEIRKAKKFIFLEYFIISDNSMWNEILDILREKVKEKVEVRVIFDGMGSFLTLPYRYDKYLNNIGIKCAIFCPVRPILSSYQNNRDHRKILVIDGEVGYMGGINISDEYINKINRFGHWKDTAIMIKGNAVKSLTCMFLQVWDIFKKRRSNYAYYVKDNEKRENANGYIMPYTDSPYGNELIGEQIYLDIINHATKKLNIVTPYFIIDYTMTEALKHAAKRGVEVTIILPSKSDGKTTKVVGYTYYKELLESGIKIYEYTPGFVHAKMITCDYDKAIVGTINFDYRSLYLHFECATFIYKNRCIKEIEKDIQRILEQSEEITINKYHKIPIIKRAAGRVFKLFAPLL